MKKVFQENELSDTIGMAVFLIILVGGVIWVGIGCDTPRESNRKEHSRMMKSIRDYSEENREEHSSWYVEQDFFLDYHMVTSAGTTWWLSKRFCTPVIENGVCTFKDVTLSNFVIRDYYTQITWGFWLRDMPGFREGMNSQERAEFAVKHMRAEAKRLDMIGLDVQNTMKVKNMCRSLGKDQTLYDFVWEWDDWPYRQQTTRNPNQWTETQIRQVR